jgi:hypothetical protein
MLTPARSSISATVHRSERFKFCPMRAASPPWPSIPNKSFCVVSVTSNWLCAVDCLIVCSCLFAEGSMPRAVASDAALAVRGIGYGHGTPDCSDQPERCRFVDQTLTAVTLCAGRRLIRLRQGPGYQDASTYPVGFHNFNTCTCPLLACNCSII